MSAPMKKRSFAFFSFALLMAAGPVCAEPLITEAEASLPAAADSAMTLRGITRGPTVEQVSPAPEGKSKSPVSLVIKFGARNNATIDKDSVKLTYIKAQGVDLTSRVKPFVTDDGINMKTADVPAGSHVLRLDVKDSQGRSTTTMIKLSVEK